MARRDVPQNPPGTPGLRRHPGLVPLSRDHHDVLVQALALRRAGGADRPEPARAAAAGFLAHFRDSLAGHLADEEAVLLPALVSSDPEGVARVREEHTELREAATLLEAALAAGTDLRARAADLGQRLDDHVRFEERSLFERAQRVLGPDVLDRLAAALAAHRVARGVAPGCAFPRRS